MHRDNPTNVIAAFETGAASVKRGPLSAIEAVAGGTPARSVGAILMQNGKLTVEQIERVLQIERDEGLRLSFNKLSEVVEILLPQRCPDSLKDGHNQVVR